jgi:hypothetical protein
MDDLHTSKPGYIFNDREYFSKWLEGLEQLLEERDRRYEERFEAQQSAVAAAFAAQEKLNQFSTTSAKEAITKAENAQNAYNLSHNDLLRKMDEQSKSIDRDMVSRREYQANHQALVEKIDVLRESKSNTEGVASEKKESRGQTNWMVGIAITLILSTISLVMGIVNLIAK